MENAGEYAALAALLCWALGAQCFEAAGKRVGSMSVNLLRLILSFSFLSIALTWRTGFPLATDFPADAWGWLILSGIVGFSLGDMCLFRAFVEIGPRLSLLLMSLNAPMSAVLGWLFLDEIYEPRQWLGITVTLLGVCWVIFERTEVPEKAKQNRKVREIHLRGILLGIGGAAGQAIGAVITKFGMQHRDAMAATQIRVLGGILGLAVIFTILRWWPQTFRALRHKTAVAWMSGGALFGSFLGVWFYLRAMQLTSIGVVATITALLPIVVIPLAVIIHKEHVSLRAWFGAFVAFSGVALLFV